MFLEALAVAGAVTSTVASIKKNQSDRKALLNKEALTKMEAAEMQRRAYLNQELLTRKLNDVNSTAMNQFAVSSSGGAGTATDEAFSQGLFENMQKELTRAKEEADYEVSSRLREADAYGAQASAANKMTPWIIGSGLLGGSKDFYSAYYAKG
jgi:hypothetical protein